MHESRTHDSCCHSCMCCPRAHCMGCSAWLMKRWSGRAFEQPNVFSILRSWANLPNRQGGPNAATQNAERPYTTMSQSNGPADGWTTPLSRHHSGQRTPGSSWQQPLGGAAPPPSTPACDPATPKGSASRFRSRFHDAVPRSGVTQLRFAPLVNAWTMLADGRPLGRPRTDATIRMQIVELLSF